MTKQSYIVKLLAQITENRYVSCTLWTLGVGGGDAVQTRAFLWQKILSLHLGMEVHGHHSLPAERNQKPL